MADSTRVLVIDDSVLARKLPTEIFASNPEMPDPVAISQ
jgi:chemotaxis response regulator CheB